MGSNSNCSNMKSSRSKREYDLEAICARYRASDSSKTGAQAHSQSYNFTHDMSIVSAAPDASGVVDDSEMLWHASVVLVKYFCGAGAQRARFERLLRNKRVLEISSGLGHLTFALKAVFGCEVLCTDREQVMSGLFASL